MRCGAATVSSRTNICGYSLASCARSWSPTPVRQSTSSPSLGWDTGLSRVNEAVSSFELAASEPRCKETPPPPLSWNQRLSEKILAHNRAVRTNTFIIDSKGLSWQHHLNRWSQPSAPARHPPPLPVL